MTEYSPPAAHEIEVSVFGRGFGEAILVHYGDNRWLLVDSLCNADRTVAPLSYLQKLGILATDAIKTIVVTHWHTDHIEGISEVYRQAPNAIVAMPLPMNAPQLEAFQERARQAVGSDYLPCPVAELDAIACLQSDEGREPINLVKAHSVLLRDAALSHNHPVTIESLSPSHASIQTFLKTISYGLPDGEDVRPEPFEQNDIAIALWITIGDQHILLGSDLEDSGDPFTGWEAILASKALPTGKAGVFKIAHHGSHNGHNDKVWSSLLVPEPLAAMTTWNRGSKLPKPEDLARIMSKTQKAYIASKLERKISQQQNSVEKKLKDIGATVKRLPGEAGIVRIRFDLTKPEKGWEVKLLNGAVTLSDFAA